MNYRVFLKVDDVKRLSRVIVYDSGARVVIPINPDGSIRWADDTIYQKSNQEDQ